MYKTPGYHGARFLLRIAMARKRYASHFHVALGIVIVSKEPSTFPQTYYYIRTGDDGISFRAA